MPSSRSTPELVSLSISAWSLKARFALKHHAVKYTTTPYTPLIGEFLLRLRLCKWGGKLSVPVMFTPSDGVLLDSFAIAKWAEAHGTRPGSERLFPPGAEAEVESWNAKSDALLNFARGQLLDEMRADPAQLAAQVPPGMRWMGPLGAVFVRAIVGHLGGKYRAECSSTSMDKALAVLRELQAALKRSGGQYLIGGQLSYADICMAVAVQLVKPLGPPFANAPRPPVEVMKPYQDEFADLVAWRDSIFAKHFPAEGGSGGRKNKSS